MADFWTENDLVVATSASRILVRIKADGTLVYGPEYTPDEAASVFWQTLARKRTEAERRAMEETQVNEILYRHMETLLLAAGEADLANQIAQEKVTQLAAASTAEQKAQRTQANLDATVANEALHQAAYRLIELGRKLALRGAEDPISDDPNPTNLN
jgi:hypothetical protein